MPTTYRSGSWFVIVRPGAVVALPPDTSPDVVAEMWDRMPQHRALATVLDILASQAGGVLTSLPPFAALFVEDGGIRIALRGRTAAHLGTSSGAQELSGADVTTWSERFLSDASRVEITLEPEDAPDAGGPADDRAEATQLAIENGVVRAAAVHLELSPADLTPEAPAPHPPADVPSVETVAPPSEKEDSLEAPQAAPAEPAPAEPAPEESEPAHPNGLQTPVSGELTLAPPREEADQPWDATVHSVPAPAAPSEPALATPHVEGDHDGSTISAAELRAVRQQPAAASDAPTAVLPVVPAAAGRLRVSTGQVVTLDRTVVIGRRPRSTRASSASMPHLIAVNSPEQDISRSHLEIRPEGDTVVVIDLHTTNGSTLLRPGADPMRLHPGEQTLVLSGDVVDLGDGVRVTFEDLP